MGRIFPHSTKPAPPFLTCSRNWSTPTLPRSLVCFPTSTPKPRVVGRVRAGGTQATSRPSRQARPSPSAPAKIREVSTMLASLFFVSGHKGSATRHGCALRSACRGGLQPGGLRPGPTEAGAETSSSLDFLLAFRVFSSGFTHSQLFPSPPAPKTHPVSPFSAQTGCVFLFFAVFWLQNFCPGFCAPSA